MKSTRKQPSFLRRLRPTKEKSLPKPTGPQRHFRIYRSTISFRRRYSIAAWRNSPTHLGQEGVAYARAQECRKYQYMPDSLTPAIRAMFYAFNSRPFIRILENITGIKGLIPDPYFVGAGLHEIKQGGHLSIHADFNHHKPLNLERRINILVYLNKGWRDEYGGQLELWDTSMRECIRSIVPLFGRCVIFNTTEESNHGNPHPINHPEGVSRKSIALYYYTSTWVPREREHTTQFRVRPDSKDRIDWKVHMQELLVDLSPPLLYRAIRRVKRQISGVRD
jgi:Rps23 Pro-64 3,4-dihydroxylase Tpa1-like proline 4-hydroxylase